MYPQGGYKTITPVQVANALALLDRRSITFRSLRVYLAAFELQARREAAERGRRPERRRRPPGVRYRAEEFLRLVPDLTERAVAGELRRLKRAGLLAFLPEHLAITQTPLDGSRPFLAELCAGRKGTRPVPVPRRLLALLCRSRKPALTKTFLAYLLRGLAIDRTTGEVRSAGAVKATWIAGVFGLSERAVRSARAELIALGVVSKDTGSHQRKLNRDGAYFRVNLAWGAGAESSAPADTRFAPPTAETPAEIAPPEKRPETPSDLKDQKLAARDGAGVCDAERKVNLRNIRPQDLRRLSTLRELFRQAAAAGWVERGEAAFLAFAAAAVRANRAAGDPVRIFVAIVRRKLWHHITHADEERARVVIGRAKNRAAAPDGFTRELLRRIAA